MKYVLVILSVLACLAGASQAFALADPDVINLVKVYRYSDVAVSGDDFLLVEYDLEYAVLPIETIGQGWSAYLVDYGGSASTIFVRPYSGHSIPDLGYSYGVFGFYAQSGFGETGTLRLYLTGNPSLSPTPVGIYTEAITTRSSAQLADDLREIAVELEDIWDVDLISPENGGVNRFTSDGEHYFTSALPNLKSLAPDLFTLQISAVDTPSRSYDSSYTTGLTGIWTGTNIDTLFSNLGTALNTSNTVARFIAALAITLTIMAFAAIGLYGMASKNDRSLEQGDYAAVFILGFVLWAGCFLAGLLTPLVTAIPYATIIVILVMKFFWDKVSQ